MDAGKEKESLLATEHRKDRTATLRTIVSKDDSYRGARPKVRKGEELKRKRMALRKARSLSRGQLEMVEESKSEMEKSKTEDDSSATQKLLPSSENPEKQEAQKEEKDGCPEYFGVKSYLHSFYESVTVKDPYLYEEFMDYRYLIAPRKRRRGVICWKGSIWLGINLLIFGAVLMLVGYLVPRKQPVVGHQQEMAIIDHAALSFNRNMDLCKIIGLVVFCIGGVVLTIALLLPSLLNQYCDEDYNTEEFKVAVHYKESPQHTAGKKIPATEEVANIQPKAGTVNEVVMTNSGLCKVP